MGTGKKIGIAAVICLVLFIVCGIVLKTQMPEINPEIYDVIYVDYELAMEMVAEDMNNAPTLYKIADTCFVFVGLAGIILAIVSIVKMAKNKEKGIIIPILVIIAIVVIYFVISYSIVDMGAMMEAAMNSVV